MPVLRALKTFIRPHPVLHPEAGDIYTPQADREIRFFFEGGHVIVGRGPTLEINFNDPKLLILSTESSVFRFKRTALIGFELILPERETSSTSNNQIKGLRLVPKAQ